MKLLDEIVDALGSENVSLAETLLKTKILLHRLGLSELASWVNAELNGYPDGATLPPYRIIPAQVFGNISNAVMIYKAHPIPIGHLTVKQRDDLESSKMDQSIAVLQDLSAGKGSLQAGLRMELNGILGKSLSSGFVVQRAWCEISPSAVKGILVQVRSRLLDFLLELETKLPPDSSDEELRGRATDLGAADMFKNAVFGPNATVNVVVGNANKQVAVRDVGVGDLQSLVKALSGLNVDDADLRDLENAIRADEGSQAHQEKRFGTAVGSWFDKMLSKAADASWQVELNIAAGILTTKLQAFYGWLT